MLWMMLSLSHRGRQMAEDQRVGAWDTDKYSHAFVELSGSTMGILALGDIGKAVARRAYGFDIDVYAVDINPVSPPPQVREVWGLERLDELIANVRLVRCNCAAHGRVARADRTRDAIGLLKTFVVSHRHIARWHRG